MSRPLLAAFLAALLSCLALLCVGDARASGAFYVTAASPSAASPSAAKPVAEASHVVLMREGTRTVVSLQNDYKGPPERFAMVVPVPVAVQPENVKTLRREVFDRIERLSAPRLVETWEQDPCAKAPSAGEPTASGADPGDGGSPRRSLLAGAVRLGGSTVVIEALFQVGEYEIAVLGAKGSSDLETWLRENDYSLPDNAEPVLRPYVAAGSKFLAAKVDVTKVKLENGRASLSPLRFHYDSERLELPVHLGMLSSPGTQDLLVHVLAPSQRYVVANHPNVFIPTDLDVTEATRRSFPAFYAALLDHTLAKTPSAVVTEYVWSSSSCDPCPAGVSGLSETDLATLGADVLPSTRTGISAAASGRGPPSITITRPVTHGGKLAPETIESVVRRSQGAVRFCYESGLQSNANLQGKLQSTIEIDPSGAVISVKDAGSDVPDASVGECVRRVLQRMVLPKAEDQKATSAVITIVLNTPSSRLPPSLAPAGTAGPGAGAAGAGRLGGFRSALGSFVLTRMHARVGKDSFGSDLLFQPAPATSFQARYAVRHAWSGPLTCKEPRRGTWGAPWRDAGAKDQAPLTATRLAYAPRGNVTLASFLPNGVPEPAAAAVPAPLAEGDGGAAAEDAATAGAGADGGAGGSAAGGALADGGAAAPAPSSRCGCHVVGARVAGEASTFTLALAALAATLALARVRARARAGARGRSRHAPCDS